MNHWKIKTGRTDAPEGVQFAIVGPKDEVVGWVKKKADAVFIKAAQSNVRGLRSDVSHYRRMYLGQILGQFRR